MKDFIYIALERLIIFVILFVIFFASIYCGSQAGFSVYADTVYSDVLDDLESFGDFNISDYPADDEDYSLEVIKVARAEGQVFIYVYQPYTGSAYDLTATGVYNYLDTYGTITSSNTINPLTLVSSSGTLYKYLVGSVGIYADGVIFGITSICRAYYAEIDGGGTVDDTTGDLIISVNNQWNVINLDGESSDGNSILNFSEFNWKTALSILLSVILIILLFPLLLPVLRAVVWVISLPFKLIGKIIKSIEKSSSYNKYK